MDEISGVEERGGLMVVSLINVSKDFKFFATYTGVC